MSDRAYENGQCSITNWQMNIRHIVDEGVGKAQMSGHDLILIIISV